MKTHRVLFIFGTRPEVIKVAPLILSLRKFPRIYEVVVCNTEQQKELSEQTLLFFGLKADINLDVMRENQTLEAVQSRLLVRLKEVVSKSHYDSIVVQGDTISAFVGALVGYFNKIPVFHLEAGLRSGNLNEPMPEEGLRQMISRVASLHFCPTIAAKTNLLSEGIRENVFITGNTVIDAFSFITEHYQLIAKQKIDAFQNRSQPMVLITCHRRENHGKRLADVIKAIQKLAATYHSVQFIIPVHPNPNVKTAIYDQLSKIDNVILCSPLDYPQLIELQKRASLILTDSGGIQEEAPSFGTPILVLRHTTERPEGIVAGCARLIGTNSSDIFNTASEILERPDVKHQIPNPYGDGKACEKIIEIMNNYFHSTNLEG